MKYCLRVGNHKYGAGAERWGYKDVIFRSTIRHLLQALSCSETGYPHGHFPWLFSVGKAYAGRHLIQIHNRVFSTSFPVVYYLFSNHLASEVPEFLKKTWIPDVAGQNIISLWRHLVLSVRRLTLVCCPKKWHQITGQEKMLSDRKSCSTGVGSLAINVGAVQSSTRASLLC